jgi:NADPH:quinone reductase-like Zn-dependent oxidoreductase
LAHEITTAPIPDSLPYEQAVVLPLAISTAAAGLYQKGYLELPYPTTDTKSSGKTILIWGGSSSVGSATIQLAIASGLEVVSTSSKKNFEFVKSLGAKRVYDHSDSTAVKGIVAALKETDFVGAYDAISLPESIKPTIEIVHQLGGGKVATVLPYTGDLPSNVTTHQGTIGFVLRLSELMLSFSRGSIYSNRSTRGRQSCLGEVYPGSIGKRLFPG